MGMDSDEQQEFETVGATPFLTWWLEDPERAKFYYDILEQLIPILGPAEASKQTLYMCFKMMTHFLGRSGIVVTGTAITLTEAVKAAIVEMTATIAGSKMLTMIAVGAMLLLLFLGIMWIVNPKFKGTRTISWPRGRWLMRYEEKLWWADLVGTSMKGIEMFTRCQSIPGSVINDIRGPRGRVPIQFVPGDTMLFYGTWFETGWKLIYYQTISWTHIKASYVGLLEKVGSQFYRLLSGHDETWLGDVQPGYRKPPELWCAEPQRTVKDVMINV